MSLSCTRRPRPTTPTLGALGALALTRPFRSRQGSLQPSPFRKSPHRAFQFGAVGASGRLAARAAAFHALGARLNARGQQHARGLASSSSSSSPRYDAYRALPPAQALLADASSETDIEDSDVQPPPPAVTWWPPPLAAERAAAASAAAMVEGTEDPFALGLHAVAAAAAAAAAAAPAPAPAPAAAAVANGNGGAAGGEGDKAAPSVDVTRHNFEAMLPVVKRYLAACDFFAFDCEMTGLFLEGQNENYLDDMQDRYNRTAAAAHSFIITQFGVSCFKRLPPGAGAEGERSYLAATFNFYVFPRPAENGPASSNASRRFTCDAGSLAFLASQGFDFNRCIYDGIPFMPVRQRDELLRQLERDYGSGPEAGGGGGGNDVVLSKAEDIAFVQGLVTSVREWLAGGAQRGEALELPPVNRYLRLLSYQALARPENFGGPVGGAPGWHPGFYVKKAYDSRNNTFLRLAPCASAAEAAALEAETRVARRAELTAAAGFTAVWEAMRESGRPAVGHNCMFDVAYCVAQFGEGRLPPTWAGFKSAVASWFRGGLYDTKHVCRDMRDLVGSDSTLGLMFKTLLPQPKGEGEGEGAAGPDGAPPTPPPATDGAAADTASASPMDSDAPAPRPPAPALPARVSVLHAPGFEKYVAVAAGRLAHEAGYDAYMTGSVFAALEALAAERPAKGEQAAPAADAPAALAPYASLVPYAWRLNVTRSDLPYALMRPAVPGDPSSAEPVPQRPLVFYLGTLSYNVRAADIHRCCEEAGLGKVRITFLPGNNALVEVASQEAAAAAAGGALSERGLCSEVLPYAAYWARKEAMLAAGTWPLPGYGGYGGGGGGGAGARGAPGANSGAQQRPVKRPRAPEAEPGAAVEERKPLPPQAVQVPVPAPVVAAQAPRQCAIM